MTDSSSQDSSQGSSSAESPLTGSASTDSTSADSTSAGSTSAGSTSAAGESLPHFSDQQPLVLGVDGGGTKTLAWVGRVDRQGVVQVVGRGSTGSSNQVAVGVETALEQLEKAIAEACSEASIPMNRLASSVFALAGSGNDEARRILLDFVSQRLEIANCTLIHDGQAVLEAATPDGFGIALIAGTGTVAYGKSSQQKAAVVGGWGYWFGDEGSAYWLGQAALRAASQAADGRAPGTVLTEKILARLGISEPRRILTAMRKQGDIRHAMAALADVVCESAEQPNDVASSILDQAVANWVAHINCLATQLSIEGPSPIALAGGVLCGSEIARSRLSESLATCKLKVSAIELIREPVAGCVSLAWRKMNSDG